MKEIKVGKEIMKCYKLNSISERRKGNYSGLCMFGYFDNLSDETTGFGEWGYYKNGLRNGNIVIWNRERGCTRGYCKEEMLEGEVIYNYISGNMEKCNYKNGVREGSSLYIWKNGGLEERYYRNGTKNGTAIRKFMNYCEEHIIYVNDAVHGKSKYIYPDGRYKERIYDNDRIIGDEILFTKEGEFIAVIKNKNEEERNEKEINYEFLIEKITDKISENIYEMLKEIDFNSNKKTGLLLKKETEKKLEVLEKIMGESKENIIDIVVNKYNQINLLTEKINFKDEYGRKQGKWVEHDRYEESEGSYIDNMKDGEWVIYDTDGEKRAIQKYINGKLYAENHFDDYYHELRKWEVDENGKKQGEWIREKNISIFDEKSEIYCRVREVIQYENDLAQGKFVSYDYNGNKCEEGYYKDGKLNGNYKCFIGETGKIVLEGEYINGKREGKWKESRYGEVIYKNGLKTGEFSWCSGKTLIKKEIYREDGKMKIESSYYSSGEIRAVRNYKFNGEEYKQEGIAVRSTAKNKYLVTTYTNGTKDEEWSKWDRSYEELIEKLGI